MTAQPPKPNTFGRRLGLAFLAFLRALLRLLAILILLGLIGAVVYFGIPALYQQYISPLEQRVLVLEENQMLQEQSTTQLQDYLNSLLDRISELETSSDTYKQTLNEYISQATQNSNAQVKQIAGIINTQTALQSQVNDLETQLTEVSQLQDNLNTLQEQLDKIDERLSDLEKAPDSSEMLGKLQVEIQIVKSMELLTRSRFSLVQSNFGLARQDLQTASEILASLEVPDFQRDYLEIIIEHLKAAISFLPNSPVLASEELELAWQMLKQGFPLETTPTPLPETPAVESTPGIETNTPTPTPTP